MSHKEMIYSELKRGKRMTPKDALKRLGCFRLAARIRDLRKEGTKIKTVMVEFGNKRVANYVLA